MASISELRAGIKTNLATISGLRVSDFQPDNINPPVAIVFPISLNYDETFNRGMQTYTFAVQVIVGRVSERSGQSTIDSYCSSTGSNSIKLAIESDKTLAGKAFDLRVTDMRNYGELLVGEVNYLSAEFVVLCYAD
jgi:hypothetical protein